MIKKRLRSELFLFALFFIGQNSVFGQCNTAPCPVPMQNNNPALACVLPNPQLLFCHQGVTLNDPVIVNELQVPDACFQFENNHFYAFTATSSTAEFEIAIDATGCAIGDNGIEAVVLFSDDCMNFDVRSNCVTTIEEGETKTVEATGLIPGNIYLLMLDGIAGSICEYTISTSNNQISGFPTDVCVPSNNTGVYTSTETSNWTINPPSAGTILGSPIAPTVDVLWTQEGTAEICATSLNCPNAPAVCMNITIGEDKFEVHESDMCIGGSTICGSQTVFSPGIHTVNYTTWTGCDSTIQCIISLIPPIPPTQFEATLCGNDTFEVCGNLYTTPGIYTTNCINFQGCDSIVVTDLLFLDHKTKITPPDLISCTDTCVILDGTGSVLPDNYAAVWTDNSGNVLGDQLTLEVCATGFYTLSIEDLDDTLSFRPPICESTTYVQGGTSPPNTSSVNGPSVIYGNYAIFSTGTPLGVTDYHWSGTPTIVVVGDEGNIVLADVGSSGFPVGEICLNLENDCGIGPETCKVYSKETPPFNLDILGETNFCISDSPGVYVAVSGDTSVTTINWFALNGEVLSGNGNTEAVIEWDTDATSGGVCAFFHSNDFGIYQWCELVEFVNPDTTYIENFICEGDCFNYLGTDLCDSGIYDFWFTASAGCDSLVQIEIIIANDAPEISGTNQVCEGETAVFQVENYYPNSDLIVTVPSDWTYTVDLVNYQIHVIFGSQSGELCVQEQNFCGTSPQTCHFVHVSPTPTATLTGDGTICEGSGDEVLLLIESTGNAEWYIDWQINGVPQPQIVTFNDLYTLAIDEGEVGFIELTGVSDSLGCPGIVSGAVQVNAIDAPIVSNVTVQTDVSLQFYTLQFEISGGDPSSYFVMPFGTGTLSGNVFTSNPIQCGDGYYFIVSDANDCDPTQISASDIQCECETEAGDMDLTPIEVCGVGPVTAIYDNSGLFLDANDVLNFALHTEPNYYTSDVLKVNVSETFSFDPATMDYYTIYYISAIAGNDDGNGFVDPSDPCFTTSQSVPIVFYEAPTAIMYGDADICPGESADIFVDLTGEAPWTFVYSDGANDFTITTHLSPFVLTVSQPGTYTILNVQDAICPGYVTGSTIVTEALLPTAEISGGGSICAGSGETVDFEINLTGTPQWWLNYTIDGGNLQTVLIDSSPFSLSLDESQAGEIEFTNLNDANCQGSILGQSTFQVDVKNGLTTSNLVQECNATGTDYIVTFEITGGTMPFTIDPPGSGTISGNPPYIFTSYEIPSGSTYDFTISDDSGCDPVSATGVHICDCVTQVGQMDNLLSEQCGTDPVTVTYDNTNEFLDGDDNLVFVLHKGPNFNIVDLIDTNPIEPTFGFNPGLMNFGETYYISAVAGNNDGTGQVDLTDPCLAVAPGTPVIWHEPPTGILSAQPNTLCDDEVILVFELTGEAPWTFTYEDLGTGNTETIIAFASPMFLTVVQTISTTYTLISVEDSNCPGDVTGSVTVNSVDPPEIDFITPDTTICDEIELLVESTTAVTYEWSPAADLDCPTCPSPIATPEANTNYSVTVTDADGCTAEANVEVFVQCLTVYDTLEVGDVSIQSLNLPPWQVLQADVCLDEEEHTSIGWFPDGLFYVGLSEGQDTICILLQHPTNVFNTEVFTIYVTVLPDDPFGLTGDNPETQADLTNFQNLSNLITVYPNPTRDILNIDSKNEVIKTVEIFDLSGKAVLKTDLNFNRNQLNIGHLNSGSYFVKIKTETEILYRKVVLIE